MNLRLVCGTVANGRTASFAAMNYDIAALRIRRSTGGAKNAAALVGAVAGVYINVERAKAKRAVISRGVTEGENLLAAVFAYKSAIVF